MKTLIGLFLIVSLRGGPAYADIPSIHGMLVFGGSTAVYASHLPMFHPPHDRQLILRITFEDLSHSSAREAYARAVQAGKTLFTLEPEVMDLEEIVSGRRKDFLASLFDGHFERNGIKLGEIRVHVEEIVFSSRLNSKTSGPADRYLVFGESETYFAAHQISGMPSFDAILEVTRPSTQGVCRRICPEPLPVSDSELPITLTGPEDALTLHNQFASGHLRLKGNAGVEVKKLIYIEEEELGS